MTELCHLSGGQKTLVSAAFIFAMQMCDPVPFYILDEIDAALDARGRKRIADWMATRNDVQFICITFWKEFLERADRYGDSLV